MLALRKLTVFLAVWALSCGGLAAAWAQETLKIGFGGAINGEVASYGLSGLRGVEFAVEKINAQGGVQGKRVEIVKEDDACAPDMASKAGAKLLSAKVRLIVGHTCSSPTITALGVYKNEVILISPSATEVDLTASGRFPYFFRTIARDDDQSRLQAGLVKKLGLKKAALIHDKGEYGLNLVTLARPMLEESGVEIVLFEGITTNQMDYGAVVSKIKRSGADAVLFGGYYPEASKIISQMGKRGIKAVFIGADGIRDPTFIKIAGQYAEGVYSTGPIDVRGNALAQEALDWNQKKYGDDPGMYFFSGAAATLAILNALEKAGPEAPMDDYKKILTAEAVDTPLGKIKFDAQGDAEGIGFVLYQVQKGAFVPVE